MQTDNAVTIPLPPSDQRLGSWEIALEGDAMGELIGRHLLARHDAWHIVACRPNYVKYNPARYGYVQYELTLCEGITSTTTTVVAWVAMLRDDRAVGLWSEPALHRLSRRAAALFPDHVPDYACYLPELRAALQIHPVDLWLPGLVEAASPAAMSHHLETAFEGSGQPTPHVQTVELVRYKAGKRAVLRYQLASTGDWNGGASAFYGKLRADDRSATVAAVSRALASAGLATPPPLAYLPDLRMLVQAEARGVRLKDLRGCVEYDRWLHKVAETLAGLHSTRIQSLELPISDGDVGELQAAARQVSALLPALADQTTRLASRIEAALDEVQALSGAFRTIIHGSFHDDQVLVDLDKNMVTLVDLDSVAFGDPLLDVGHFLAYLSADGASEQTRERFLDAYLDSCRMRGMSVPPAPEQRSTLFEAATLLRWCTLPFRELDPHWPAKVEQRVNLAAQRLSEFERDRERTA